MTIRCCIAGIMGVENPVSLCLCGLHRLNNIRKRLCQNAGERKIPSAIGKIQMADGNREKAVSIETDKDKIFYR